jgi:hypothetical protein
MISAKWIILFCLLGICFLVFVSGCNTGPNLVVGSKVMLRPTTLHVDGEKIEMYGGNALLFKSPVYMATYLGCLKKGNLGKAGQLLLDKVMLPVDKPIQATLLEYKDGNGPSRIQLDLDALPTSWKRSNWEEWANCYVFNIHIEPQK